MKKDINKSESPFARWDLHSHGLYDYATEHKCTKMTYAGRKISGRLVMKWKRELLKNYARGRD